MFLPHLKVELITVYNKQLLYIMNIIYHLELFNELSFPLAAAVKCHLSVISGFNRCLT